MVIDWFYIFWVFTICQWLRYRMPSGKSLSGREDRQPWSHDEHMVGCRGRGKQLFTKKIGKIRWLFFFFPVRWFLNRTSEDEQDFCQKEKKKGKHEQKDGNVEVHDVFRSHWKTLERNMMWSYLYFGKKTGQYGEKLFWGDSRGVVLSVFTFTFRCFPIWHFSKCP